MSTPKTPEERAKAYWIQCKNTGMRLYMAAAIEQAHLAGWHARDEEVAAKDARIAELEAARLSAADISKMKSEISERQVELADLLYSHNDKTKVTNPNRLLSEIHMKECRIEHLEDLLSPPTEVNTGKCPRCEWKTVDYVCSNCDEEKKRRVSPQAPDGEGSGK